MLVTAAGSRKSLVMEATAYILAIAAAEVVTMFFHPLWGIIGHAAIMATVIGRAARIEDRDRQRLVLSLALVPLIRIVDLSLSLYLLNLPVAARLVIVYTPLIIASVVLVRVLGYRFSEVGLTLKSPRVQAGVAFSGILFGWVEYLILKPEPLVSEFSFLQAAPLALVLLVTTGFAEEFSFRGVLQRSAVGVFGWPGVIYVASLFALLHIGFHSPLDVVFVFGVAMFFGWVVKRTGSLVGVVVAHGLTNILLFLVYPVLL
jgi:uncharacterized protein